MMLELLILIIVLSIVAWWFGSLLGRISMKRERRKMETIRRGLRHNFRDDDE